MSIKKVYYYLFYKLYKLNENDIFPWVREWKAGLFLDVLIIFILFSGFIYYTIYVNPYVEVPNIYIIAGLYIFGVGIPNYFIFHHADRYKEIIEDFDKLPKQKNRIGSWIVGAVVLIVIANLIFSFYLMSQIDWTAYR